ncbi:MAG TPA: hypothetical protein VE715_10525 [Blastocatellia bacterium]|nr:hypothetical protein [Blastocatellia bacterium]
MYQLNFQMLYNYTRTYELPRNLLGSIGWLRNLSLWLVDYDELLYLGAYDS